MYPLLDLSKNEAAVTDQHCVIATANSIHQGQDHFSVQKKVALAPKQNTNFKYIANDTKRVGKCRATAYPEQEYFFLTEIIQAWDKGATLARLQAYDLLRKKWPQPHPSHPIYLTPNKVSALSLWLSRSINRHGWVIRKFTASQKFQTIC